jgi:hypothetical protein
MQYILCLKLDTFVTSPPTPQVQLQAIPYFVVDVRQGEDAADDPLPSWLQGALSIPGTLLMLS